MHSRFQLNHTGAAFQPNGGSLQCAAIRSDPGPANHSRGPFERDEDW